MSPRSTPRHGQCRRHDPDKAGRACHVHPPGGKIIYVTDRESGYISILDAKTLAVIKTFQMPGGPDDMGLCA